jgi:galactoside O-acetyltransferase
LSLLKTALYNWRAIWKAFTDICPLSLSRLILFISGSYLTYIKREDRAKNRYNPLGEKMTNIFYSFDELKNLGFKTLGEHILISRKASIYGSENIELGSNIRIDDFCILSGRIKIGNYVHVAAYTSLCGGNKGIVLEDFVNLSRKVEIFAVSDDFNGVSMTNPMVPDDYKNIVEAEVILRKHVVVGAGSVILPSVVLEEGSVVGALSLVKNSTLSWSINAGIPAKKIKNRRKDLLEFEKRFMEEKSSDV